MSLIFRIAIIAIFWIIILMILRVMYKDIKNGGKRKVRRKTYGLEIIETVKEARLEVGTVYPISREITIGRKDDNQIKIKESYISANHAKVYVKNEEHILEDLNSTNGTLLNKKKIEGKKLIKPGDEIKIGNTVFKVIG